MGSAGRTAGAAAAAAGAGGGSPLVDLHCHILPGLDDGPSSMAESLKMARVAVAAGFATIVATPHVMAGVFEATPPEVERTAAALQSKCDEAGLDLTILPGSEVYLDENTHELARAGRLVHLGAAPGGGKKYLLVELPQHDIPHYTRELLFRISIAGFKVLLAHPERNATLRENHEMARELVAAGALLQLNAGSLSGMYGRHVRQAAERWLDDGMYSAIGSDWHSADEPNSLAAVAASGRRGVETLLCSNFQMVSAISRDITPQGDVRNHAVRVQS